MGGERMGVEWAGLRFKRRKREGREKKEEKEREFRISPKYIQVQAALFLGSKRISDYVYTPLVDFSTSPVFRHELTFTKRKTPLFFSNLPSFCRVCFNLILLESATKSRTNKRKGWVLGSVSTTLFSYNRVMKTGVKGLKLWSFEEFDERIVC